MRREMPEDKGRPLDRATAQRRSQLGMQPMVDAPTICELLKCVPGESTSLVVHVSIFARLGGRPR